MENDRLMAFYITLPEIPDSLFIDDNKDDKDDKDEAKVDMLLSQHKNSNQLQSHQTQSRKHRDSIIINENDNINIIHNHITKIPISLIAKKLFNDLNIINAFKSLYFKYIDPQNAQYMINISSTNRFHLVNSLDSSHYKKSIAKQTINTSSTATNMKIPVPQFIQRASRVKNIIENLNGSHG